MRARYFCLTEIRSRTRTGCTAPAGQTHPRGRLLRILGKMAEETGRAADSEVAGLLAGCARQDRRAFQRLYERTAPQLLACLIRMLRHRALAEDALQDVFVQVWGRAGQYQSSRGSAWAWLIAIARYRAIDLRRRESRLVAGSDTDIDQIAAEDEPQDALAALGRHASKALTTCLDALQPRQRECIVLAYQGGLTHSEVAGEIGEPLGSVKSWIRRGLTALSGAFNVKRDRPKTDLAQYALGRCAVPRRLQAPPARAVRGPGAYCVGAFCAARIAGP